MAYTGKSIKNLNYNDEDVQLDPMDHKSQYTEYGVGDGTNYGHLKLSDSTASDSGESGGIAATPKAVKDAISGAGISGLTENRLIKSSSSNSITSMGAMTNNHIVVGNGSTVSTVQTKNGAFYATTNDGAASFGTLPVAQGGTGKSSFSANSLIMSGTNGTSALTTRAITTSVSSTTGTSIPTEGAVATALGSKISVTVSGATLVFS